MGNFLAGMCFMLILVVFIARCLPTDDSDRDADHRSGLNVYTDYKTGLQYLGKCGVLMPRLDADGKQVKIEAYHD